MGFEQVSILVRLGVPRSTGRGFRPETRQNKISIIVAIRRSVAMIFGLSAP
jgi:hypothetical protein